MKQKYTEAFIEQAVVKLLSRGKRTGWPPFEFDLRNPAPSRTAGRRWCWARLNSTIFVSGLSVFERSQFEIVHF
jgi:hypothetical protein